MARILVIEDDDAVRAVVRLTLTHVGHVVVEATNGREGLAQFRSENPDLVVTDIVMPDKEGLETILELSRKHGMKKIVAMSGGGRMTPDEYLKIARQMGAAAVLLKPFSNTELILAVTKVLEQP